MRDTQWTEHICCPKCLVCVHYNPRNQDTSQIRTFLTCIVQTVSGLPVMQTSIVQQWPEQNTLKLRHQEHISLSKHPACIYEPLKSERFLPSQGYCLSAQAGQQVLEEDSAQLWWAGKELDRTKLLRDFVGRNEKTKILAKLQKKGQGAPGREPVFSAEEQKAMMAFAHKKQEEIKVRSARA